MPERINYQGRMVQGTNLVNGTTSIVFRLYNIDLGGTPLYVETQAVQVVDGLYAAAIGASNAVPGALASVLTNAEVYLELVVGATTLTPRERVVSVAYALSAARLPDGAITTAMLADDAVTSGKIADGSISNADFAAGSVSGGTVLDGSVTGADLSDGTISNVDVAANTFWETDGNAGTTAGTHFLGTTDNEPLELHVNGARIARFEPGASPNVLLGDPANTIANGVLGAGIGGGDDNAIGTNASYAAIGGGQNNQMNELSQYATIAGGGRQRHRDQRGLLGRGWRLR